MEEELTQGEINALSDAGLKHLAGGGSIESLDTGDLRVLSGKSRERGWGEAFQEEVAQPIMGKIGDVVGTISSLGGDQIRQEALAKMRKEGKITQEEFLQAKVTPDEKAKIRPGLGAKLAAGSELFLQNAFDVLRVEEGDPRSKLQSKANPQIMADVLAMEEAGVPLPAINAAAMVKGQKFLWDDNNAGLIERWGSYATVGEQAVARGALNLLTQIGSIPRKDAIEIMSQTQVHGSDLVDHFWIPETAVGKIGRGIVGFAADVAIDPLTYMTLGAGPAARRALQGGAMKVGNRVVDSASMLGRLERQTLLAQNDIMRLIKTNGSVKTVESGAGAMDLVRSMVDDGRLMRDPGALISHLKDIDPQLADQALQVIRTRQTQTGVVRSLARGETSVNFAFRLPFTKTLIETGMPLFGQGTRWAAQGALGVKDWAFDSAARVAGSIADRSPVAGRALEFGQKIGDLTSQSFQSFKTFTTRPLWDSGQARYIHAQNANSQWANREMQRAIKDVGDDPETSRLMVDWLNQMPTHSDEELLRRFEPYNPENVRYVSPGGTDYTKLRHDPSSRGTDWAMEQYKDSQEYAARQRGRYLDNPIRSPKGPLSQSNTPLFEANPKYTKLELKEQARNFVSPLRTGSDGRFTPGIADSPNAGGFASGLEFTAIKPTKDLIEANRVGLDLRKTREMADQTMSRLEMKNPGAAQRVRQIREQFNYRISEMEKRGIPFQSLNPFDQTIPVEERAMGYFPHIMNPDYLDAKGVPKYQAALDAFQDHQAELGLIDRTQVGRADRRATNTIIDSIKKSSEINEPIFVNDPISASYMRMQDMDNIIAQHDFLNEVFPLAVIQRPGGKLGAMSETVKSEAFNKLNASYVDDIPPRGFVEMDWKEFASPVFKRSGGPATLDVKMAGDLQAKEFLQFKSFMPEQYKVALREGERIFFPEDVASRMKYAFRRQKGGIARSALDLYNYWFRNGALYGTWYQGMNFFSNITTYMTAGADLGNMPAASKFLYDAGNRPDKVFGRRYAFGSGARQLEMSGEELLDLSMRNGIINNSMVSEADVISDIWDNMATTYSSKEKMVHKAATTVDKVTTFKYNRHLAEQADNMFRMGLFMDSLEKGYTIEGARERVMLYFYDFKDVPRGQQFAANVMPFTTFAAKSLESVAQRAASLDLRAITIPYRVKNILDGAFVESYQEREFLKKSLPDYSKDDVIGPALPGAHHMMVSLPFILPAIKTYLNPQDNMHPLIQSAAMVVAAMGQGSVPQDQDFEAANIDSEIYKSKWDEFYGNMLTNMIPPVVKNVASLNQMRNPDDVRMLPLDFVSKYKTQQYGLDAPTRDLAITLTDNAQAFGDYAKSVSPNWFYNALMFGQLQDPNVPQEELADKNAMYGNLVRSHLRNMSLGFARMQRMDRVIISRLAAIQRHLADVQRSQTKAAVEANLLRDPLAKPSTIVDRQQQGEKILSGLEAELEEGMERKAALEAFYGFYLDQEKKQTGFFDSVVDAISPRRPDLRLTQDQADDQNMLIEKGPELEMQRRKKLNLQLQDAP